MFKTIKNAVGAVLGYGTCPNCKASWAWAPHCDIIYEECDDGTGSGVLLCLECATNPASVDVERISTNLLNSGWQPTDVELVKVALADYTMPSTT